MIGLQYSNWYVRVDDFNCTCLHWVRAARSPYSRIHHHRIIIAVPSLNDRFISYRRYGRNETLPIYTAIGTAISMHRKNSRKVKNVIHEKNPIRSLMFSPRYSYVVNDKYIVCGAFFCVAKINVVNIDFFRFIKSLCIWKVCVEYWLNIKCISLLYCTHRWCIVYAVQMFISYRQWGHLFYFQYNMFKWVNLTLLNSIVATFQLESMQCISSSFRIPSIRPGFLRTHFPYKCWILKCKYINRCSKIPILTDIKYETKGCIHRLTTFQQ